MSCEACVGYLARNEQLERDLEDRQRHELRLLERFQVTQAKLDAVTRELREAKEELRVRRSITGYLPHLDVP